MTAALATLSAMLHALRVAFGAYNLYLCSISIGNLREYEATSKKLAEWSNTAAEQLARTRKTQGSGTTTILMTCVSSLYFLGLPLVRGGFENLPTEMALAAANVVALVVARNHVGDFWQHKAKIPMPGMGDYNEAISKTMEVRLHMLYLMVSWVVGGALVGLRWMAR